MDIEWQSIEPIGAEFARLDEEAQRRWFEMFRLPAAFLVCPRRFGKNAIFALYAATLGLSSLPIEGLNP